MPELPEVETIRRGLAEHVCGRIITDVVVHHPRAIRHVLGGAGEFQAKILGRTIIGLGRRRNPRLRWYPKQAIRSWWCTLG